MEVWIKNMYTKEYFSAMKEEYLAICYHMDGTGGNYPKWDKSEKDKYRKISLTDGIFSENEPIDTKNSLVVARGRE